VEAVPAAHSLLRFQPTVMLERVGGPAAAAGAGAAGSKPTKGAAPFLITRSPIPRFSPLSTHDIERIACHLEKPLLSTATTTTASSSTSVTNPRRPPGVPLAFVREYRQGPRLAGGGIAVRGMWARAPRAGLVSSHHQGLLAPHLITPRHQPPSSAAPFAPTCVQLLAPSSS
jgi:hypothetical protein